MLIDSLLKAPEDGREAGWGRIRSIQKSEVGNFTMLYNITRTTLCFGMRTILKQSHCYDSEPIRYTDLQYLAQYKELIFNLHEIPLLDFRFWPCRNWDEHRCLWPRHRFISDPHAQNIVNSQYGAQLCIDYIIETVFLVSTRDIDRGTMRKWPVQVGTLVANVGRELSLLRMAVDMPNVDYYTFCYGTNWSPAANSGQRGPWS